MGGDVMLNDQKNNRARWFLVALSLVIGSSAGAVLAQSGDSAAAAGFSGPERQQHLIDGARKEGEVMIYTSIQAPEFSLITAAFEKKYGLKVKVWRSSSENILQRAVSEARAGRYDVDVIETAGPELESLHREKMLQAVNSPYLNGLIEQAVPTHRDWIGTRLDVITMAYNTKLIKKEDLPKTWEDLLDPKWKGKLGIEADDADWFATISGELGEAKSVKLFRELVAANGVSVRKGHSLLLNMVASGEVPLALDIYNYKAEQMKKKGVPIDWFTVGPAVAAPMAAGVMHHAPHPNGAVLFFDFMLTEAQPIMQTHDIVVTAKKMETDLNSMPLRFIDPKLVLDENDKWDKLFTEVFNKHVK
jgi:iron(III) transport system substrate-binding protein